ncbi:hypothetical protein HYT55_02090 [Candidatus Woesearchaeota archaeon]|nr:hypothetical protein [Candidatus Woesearchaeota archaeon]
MLDYFLVQKVLLAQEGKSFSAEREPRFAAARALGDDFDALQVIAEYGKLRGCYSIREPFPDLDSFLHNKWERSSRPFWGMRPDRFINQLAHYYLGKYPSLDEVLAPELYERIYQAFQRLVVPGLMIGRVDVFAAGKVKANTLLKILEGYEEFRVFTQQR